MFLVVLSAILLCPTWSVIGQDHIPPTECPEENADHQTLARSRIFQTEQFMDMLQEKGVTKEDIEKQLNFGIVEDPKLADVADAEISLAEAVQNGESELSITSNHSDLARLIFEHYKYACPYSYYYLSTKTWVFTDTDEKESVFCWAFYPIWVTACRDVYCNMQFKEIDSNQFRYTCSDEQRFIRFPARCLHICPNDGAKEEIFWKTEYIHRLVPRGCCCKKRVYHGVPGNVCPV